MGKYIYILFLSIFLYSCTHTQISPPYQPDTITPDSYAQGRLDAEQDYQTNPAWLLAGLGCGVFGVGFAWVIPPEPPGHITVNKSPEYAVGYREAWRAKGRRDNTKMAAVGFAMWLIIFVTAMEY